MTSRKPTGTPVAGFILVHPGVQIKTVEGNTLTTNTDLGDKRSHIHLTDREPPVFSRLPAPRPQALEGLIHTISQRVGAYLEREGLLVRDIDNTYLQLEASEESAINDLLGHSITYRIALGPQAGRKAFTLQTVPAREEDSDNS